MSRKTTKSALTLSLNSGKTKSIPDNLKITTPKSNNKPSTTESDAAFYSPIFSQYSQEEYENLDVIWNWNSTQTKTRPRKHKKLDFTQSPEVTIRRPPSNNQIPAFLNLEKELETLKGIISKEEPHPSCAKKLIVNELEDIFDDSMEDQLLRCSQEVESRVKSNNVDDDGRFELFSKLNFPLTPPSNAVNNVTFNITKITKTEETRICTQLPDTSVNLPNDSFDNLLFGITDLKNSECRQLDQAQAAQHNSCHVTTQMLAKPTTIEEEIERKRQEALMKLESKKKQASTEPLGDSPIKCSPEEIEQKRLQALAKLQEKKKQEIIERNRLEALKRLGRNKQKHALQINKSSIFHKLNGKI